MNYKLGTILKGLSGALILAVVFAAPTVSFAQDITTGLVAHYKLDETTGTTAADSVNNNDGTMNSGLDAANDNTGGKIGTSLNYDGIDDAISLGSPASLDNIFTGGGNISLWAKLNNNGTPATRFIDKNTANNGWLFGIDSGYVIFTRAHSTTNGEWRTPIGSYPLNEWVHFSVSYDEGSITNDPTIYINGVSQSLTEFQTAAGSVDDDSSEAITLGNRSSLNRTLDGSIDDVRIYNRALSAEDIAVLAAGTTPGGIRYNNKSEAIEYHSGTDWVHAGLGSYSPNAVTFDGTNDYLATPMPLTGVIDSKKITGSFWMKTQPGLDNRRVMNVGGTTDPMVLNISNTDRFRFRIGDDSNTGHIVNIVTANQIVTGEWQHIIFSLDTSSTSRRHVYVDGTAATLNIDAWVPDSLMDFDGGTELFVGQQNGGTFMFEGDLADIWLDYGTYIDLSVAANRRKFISATGMPMYLGPDGGLPVGKSPDIFLSGDTAGWHTNKGTGGGLTENGALTEAAGYPGEDLPAFTLIGSPFATNSAEKAIARLTNNTVALTQDTTDTLITLSWDGSNWTQVGNALSLPTGMNNNGMTALDSQTVAIVDNTLGIRTYGWDGTDWSQTGNTFTGTNGPAAATTLNETTIAVADSTNNLRTYSWDGTDWSLVGSTLSLGTIDRPALTTLNPNTVAFADNNARLETYSWDGSTWTKLGNTLTIIGAGRPGLTTISLNEVLHKDSTLNVMQLYRWDGTDWIAIGDPTSVSGGQPFMTTISPYKVAYTDTSATGVRTFHFAHCSNPTEPRGSVLYNTDQQVMQYCNGVDWVAMGPVGGTAGSGCFHPSGNAGDFIWNEDYSVLQYCNDDDWIGVGNNNGDLTLPDLVGHWKLDETSGTIALDSSGNGNDGTMLGGMDASSDSIAGVVNTALDFDGNNDRIEIADDTTLKPKKITFMAWASGDSFGNVGHVLDKQAPGTTGYGFWEDSGQIKSFISVEGSWSSVDGPILNTSQFYHLAATYDGTTHKLYVDGALYDTHTVTGSISHSNNTLSIGREDDTTCCEWDGPIDDVRIYGRALSAAQILEVYLTGMPVTEEIESYEDWSSGTANNDPPDGWNITVNSPTSPGDFLRRSDASDAGGNTRGTPFNTDSFGIYVYVESSTGCIFACPPAPPADDIYIERTLDFTGFNTLAIDQTGDICGGGCFGGGFDLVIYVDGIELYRGQPGFGNTVSVDISTFTGTNTIRLAFEGISGPDSFYGAYYDNFRLEP